MRRRILKTCLTLMLTVATLASLLICSYAEEAPKNILFDSSNWKFKIGVDDRVRYEYRHDFNFNDTVKDSGSGYGTGSQIFNRFILNAQLRLLDKEKKEIFEAFAEGLDARVGSYQMKPMKNQKDSFDLHQGYLNFKDILGSDFNFKVGRQEMKYGSGRLIAAPVWSNRIRSFDAAVLRFHPGNFYYDFLFAADVKYRTNHFNEIQHKEKLYGLYMGYQKEKVFPIVEAYFLPQTIRNITTKSTRYTAGLRIKYNFPGDILCELEAPYQFGTNNHKTIKASALHIDIGHRFKGMLWEPNLTFTYNQASGDKNPNDSVNQTFIPLYQTTHDPYGIMDFFRWQNMREAELSLNLSVTKKLKITPQVNFFWLMSTNDSWYDSTGTAIRSAQKGIRSYHVGQEASIRAAYEINKNIKCETGYAHFFTGKFVQNSGANDDADWVYSQLTLKY